MASRKVNTINISFGLLSLPVGLYTLHREARVDFNLFSECHNAPVKYRKVCQVCGAEVVAPKKGFKASKDAPPVLLDEEELKNLPQITQFVKFVPVGEVSPLHLRGEDYYLAPEEGAERAFSLLEQVLRTLGIGILMKTVIRGKERLCFIRPVGQSLVLSYLYFPEEIKSPPQFQRVPTTQKEVEIAIDLLKQLVEEKVDWEQIKSENAEAIKNLILKKEVPKEEAPQTDLLEALALMVSKKKQPFWR